MKQQVMILGVCLALVGGFSSAALAHHGGAAFDQTTSTTFEGVVTELQFANPHVLVFWDVKNAQGQVEKWSGWLTAPNKLARAGWTKRTLNPGDHIKVSGRPHKGGSHILQIQSISGPDGQALPTSEN
jgi:hypothetical protein